MNNTVHITKASGKKVEFSEKKLRNSLQRTGATELQIHGVITEIAKQLYEGISTKRIHELAFDLLKGSAGHLAAKYHLKQAIMELGPSGYPFEKYIGEILRYQGYNVKSGVVVKGQCVQHEIDVLAQLDQLQIMIECKYHNLPGNVCDVKIPLYIQSRFKDLEVQWKKNPEPGINQYQGWVVTNTRFSNDAMQYGLCVGLRLIGWDFPGKGSLKDQIDSLGLYPITCLTSLTKEEKQHLLEKKIVLCQDLYHNPKILDQAGVNSSRTAIALEETKQLCKQLRPLQNLK